MNIFHLYIPHKSMLFIYLFISLLYVRLLIRNQKSFTFTSLTIFSFLLHVLNNTHCCKSKKKKTVGFASTMNHIKLSSKDKIPDKVHSPRFLSRVGVPCVTYFRTVRRT